MKPEDTAAASDNRRISVNDELTYTVLFKRLLDII